jgi:hypothetical protein
MGPFFSLKGWKSEIGFVSLGMKGTIKVSIKFANDGIIGYSDSKIAQSETNDCFVRTIAAALEVSYDDAHAYVAKEYGRKDKEGTFGVFRTLRTKMEILGREIEEMGEILKYSTTKRLVTRYKCYGEIVEREMTFKSFVKKYPKGTYVILVKNHAFCLKDGVVVGGNYSDATALRKRVHGAFKII